jgi:uncharacterized RDD family membrane protein YckC
MTQPLLDAAELYRDALVPTRWHKRLINFLVDYLIFVVFLVLLAAAAAVIWSLVTSEDFDVITERFDDLPPLADRLITSVLYCAYCLFFESLTNGKTLAKLLTRTRVVSVDGTKPTFNQLLKRNFSRMVPLDGFSFIAQTPQGWHDRWADVYVVDDRILPDSVYLEG